MLGETLAHASSVEVVCFVSQSPYKEKVVPGLGKKAHSKLNDFSLFPAFSILSFQVLLLICKKSRKGHSVGHQRNFVGVIECRWHKLAEGVFDRLA